MALKIWTVAAATVLALLLGAAPAAAGTTKGWDGIRWQAAARGVEWTAAQPRTCLFSVTYFKHANYVGTPAMHRTTCAADPDLRNDVFDCSGISCTYASDSISAIKVEATMPGYRLYFYEHVNYGGVAKWYPVGSYPTLGVYNDLWSSMRWELQ